MDPESYAALIEALSNGKVTFSTDSRSATDTSWTTPTKIKFGETEVVDGSTSQPLLIKVAANTPWIPTIGQTVKIVGDPQDRTFIVTKIEAKGGLQTTAYKIEARA